VRNCLEVDGDIAKKTRVRSGPLSHLAVCLDKRYVSGLPERRLCEFADNTIQEFTTQMARRRGEVVYDLLRSRGGVGAPGLRMYRHTVPI
jgi:hypothetical protein